MQRELGRGTWGTVLLARRRQDGCFYALKVVQLDKRSSRDQLAAVQECQVGMPLLLCCHGTRPTICAAIAAAATHRLVTMQAGAFLLPFLGWFNSLQVLASLESPHITRYYDRYAVAPACARQQYRTT